MASLQSCRIIGRKETSSSIGTDLIFLLGHTCMSWAHRGKLPGPTIFLLGRTCTSWAHRGKLPRPTSQSRMCRTDWTTWLNLQSISASTWSATSRHALHTIDYEVHSNTDCQPASKTTSMTLSSSAHCFHIKYKLDLHRRPLYGGLHLDARLIQIYLNSDNAEPQFVYALHQLGNDKISNLISQPSFSAYP